MPYTYGMLTLLMPVILFALAVILALALRWFNYKERMALIARDLPLEEEKNPARQNKLLLVSGLAVGLIGLAVSLGLATLGIGPWLLAGLIPFFVGLSLVLASLILHPPKEEKPVPKQPEDFTPETEPAFTIEGSEEEEEEEDGEEEEEILY